MRGVKLDRTAGRSRCGSAWTRRRGLPGVEYVHGARRVPFGSRWNTGLSVPGIDSVAASGSSLMQWRSPDFFARWARGIVRGRGFDRRTGARRRAASSCRKGWRRSCGRARIALGKCVKVGARYDAVHERGRRRREHQGTTYRRRSGCNITCRRAVRARRVRTLFIRAEVARLSTRSRSGADLQPLMPGPSYVTVDPVAERHRGARGPGSWVRPCSRLRRSRLGARGHRPVQRDRLQRRAANHEIGLRVALGAHARE